MNHKYLLIVALVSIIVSCNPQRRIIAEATVKKGDLDFFCDTLKPFKSLYISKISAEITIDEEVYDARISLYYLPDSIFFATAVNSGFEIIRIGVTKDSIVYINRLDKVVYIYKKNALGYKPPVSFVELEYLLNKELLCGAKTNTFVNENGLNLDLSEKDIDKKLLFIGDRFSLKKFEFFHKKSSEYIVGERSGDDEFLIYSNYIVDNLVLKTSQGSVEYDKSLQINLQVNSNKYEIVYF